MTDTIKTRLEREIEQQLECERESLLDTDRYYDYFCDGPTSDHKKKIESIVEREINDDQFQKAWETAKIELDYSYHSYDRAIDSIGLYFEEAELLVEFCRLSDELQSEIKALDSFTLKNLAEETDLPIDFFKGDGDYFVYENYGFTVHLVVDAEVMEELETTVYEVYFHEFFDGEVNSSHGSGIIVSIRDSDTDDDVIRKLKQRGAINKGAHYVSFSIEGEIRHDLYISHRGKPLLELRAL